MAAKISGLLNPKVYMDIAVAGRNAGRLVLELFADELPITAENFRCLCTGETGLGYYLRPRWYKHTPFHRCIPGFMCQGGDFLRGDGFGSEAIYGQFFRDEKFIYRHSKRGVLSMAKTRVRHSNSCQFFITFAPCPWLDNKHVVFGHIVSGWRALDAIEGQGTEAGFLRRPCEVFDCGEFNPSFPEHDVIERIEATTSSSVGETQLATKTHDSQHVPELSLKEDRPTRLERPQDDDNFSIPTNVYKRSRFL